MEKKMNQRPIALLIVTVLLSACSSSAQPTSTPVLRQARDEAATATPTATAEAENATPVIFGLADQGMADGERFPEFKLDNYVTDADHSADEITWSFAGNAVLDLDVADGVLTVSASDEDWRGSEKAQFQPCDAGGACDSQGVAFTILNESQLVVTYVGNEGFLISSDGKKILVDALHRIEMSPETLALLENARPPFDGIDLVLVTHNDPDHFHAETVGRHLANNPEALFVSTYQAVADLQAGYEGWDEIKERVASVQLEPQGSLQQTFNDIPVEMIELPHGDPSLQPPLNLGFIITLGKHKLLHTGDLVPAAVDLAYLQAYDLPGKHIDVLFMSHLMLLDQSYHSFLEQAFPARYLIPMHLHPVRDRLNYDTISGYFPDAIIFRTELASWLMPSEPTPSPSAS
jgi:L-ascorbate metabolism protein UlaG (beta-lactamase superfamily)